MASPAYLDALRMLGRRELSERQLRQRLARKGHGPDEIDEAVGRLREDRSLDDERVAVAVARNEASVRRHGRLRALRKIENAGIDRALARRAVDEVFGALDDDALLEAALGRRLSAGGVIADDRTFKRLYRFLVAQGFDAEAVVRALRTRDRRRG
jgi:regulatory protein